MTHPPMDPRSSEDARREAERHRREISETLDALSEKINHTVQQAEHRLNRPLAWIRENPLTAIAAATAVGFLLSGAGALVQRRKSARLTGVLEKAYYQGRQEERARQPLRSKPDLDRDLERLDPQAHAEYGARSLFMRNMLQDLASPLLRSAAAGLATVIGMKLTNRKGE